MIEPDFLDAVERFDPSLDRRIDAHRQGRQDSANVGEGLTFKDHRRYSRGDDFRLIDWKVAARTDELFVKQFEAERNLTIHALVDASASMDFGGDRIEGDAVDDGLGESKFEYAAKLGLGFAALAAAEHNQFRFAIFGDTVQRVDDSRSTRGMVLELIDRLNATEPRGSVDFERALTDYAATIDSRSLVLVASDFLADPEDVAAGVAPLSRHDVTLAQVLTPVERDPPVRGDTVFRDVETDAEIRTYFGSKTRETYLSRLAAHESDIEEIAHRFGARHVSVDTGREFFDSFSDVWVE